MKKRNLGQYFTRKSDWLEPHIKEFIVSSGYTKLIDPFAGEGDLLNLAKELGFNEVVGLDIDPNLGWVENDSLSNIPEYKDGIVITNPPYLSKNSAKRRGLKSYNYFIGNGFQDLYQVAMERVFESVERSVFIIPETFMTSMMFLHHIYSLTVIEKQLFDDTECPVCVCCFKANRHKPYYIYKGKDFLFDSKEANVILKEFETNADINVRFNVKNGNLGLRGVDGLCEENKIKFCFPKELNYDSSNIKISSRAISIMDVDFDITEKFLIKANDILNEYRNKTHDIFLSPFKNNNKGGVRRRRLDFKTARQIINKTVEELL